MLQGSPAGDTPQSLTQLHPLQLEMTRVENPPKNHPATAVAMEVPAFRRRHASQRPPAGRPPLPGAPPLPPGTAPSMVSDW